MYIGIVILISLIIMIALLKRNQRLQKSNEELANINKGLLNTNASLTEKHKDINDAQDEVDSLIDKQNQIKKEIQSLIQTQKQANEDLLSIKNEIDCIFCGISKCDYKYNTTSEYESELEKIIRKEKELKNNGNAISLPQDIRIDGSLSKGNEMLKKYTNLILRSFNKECDLICNKVTYLNYERSLNDVDKLYNTLNKNVLFNGIKITEEYKALKIEELKLEFSKKELEKKIKEEEKSRQEKYREEQRELKKLEEDIERAERDELYFQKLLDRAKKNLSLAIGIEYDKIAETIEWYKERVEEAQKNKERAISMAQQTRAGYVYVISNIGAFGEKVFKIGMTRRLNPEDRVRELSCASVPFKFDIHAMIYSDDAPTLEAELHKAFDDMRVNKINTRKEFFATTLDEIKNKVSELGIENATFINIPEDFAREYFETCNMKS